MNKKRILLPLIAVLTVFLVSSISLVLEQNTHNLRGETLTPSSVSGTMYYTDYLGLPRPFIGAEITYTTSGVSQTVYTSNQGTFSISSDDVITITGVYNKPGFKTTETLPMSFNTLSNHHDFELQSDGTMFNVTGNFVGNNGNGISGASVAYTVNGVQQTPARTDTNGNYTITAASGSVVQITSVTSGSTVANEIMPWFGDFMDRNGYVHNFTASNKPLQINGTVTDFDNPGQPIPGAVVEYTINGGLKYYAMTDPSGKYTIAAPPSAKLVITNITKSGYYIWPSNQVPTASTNVYSGLTYDFTMRAEAPVYRLTPLPPTPAGAGYIEKSLDNGVSWTLLTVNDEFQFNDKVMVRAVANAGYVFSSWTGVPFLSNPFTIYVDNNYNIGAIYYKNGVDTVYTLTPGAITGNGSITISINGGIAKPFDTAVTLVEGTPVAFTATPDSGYAFSYWTGIAATSSLCTFTVDSSRTIGSVFDLAGPTYTLTPGTITGGTINISIAGGPATPLNAPVTLAEGTQVTLTAVADSGNVFSYWTGLPTLTNPYTFSLDTNYTVGAVFSSSTSALCAIVPGAITGSGSISISIGNSGMDVPLTSPGYNIPVGTPITLTATAGPGYTFSYWTGLPTLAETYTFNIDKDYTVGAAFYQAGAGNTYTLTSGTITGNGSIKISIAGGPATLFNLPVIVVGGTQVKMQAVEDTSYVFSVWTGGISGNNNPYTLNVDMNYTIGADFVSASGGVILFPGAIVGNGSINISIAGGPAAPFTAQVPLAEGTQVTLTAVDGSDTFSYWTGIAALGSSYEFNIDGNYTVGAVFYSGTVYTLTPVQPLPSNGSISISIADGPAVPFTEAVTVMSGTNVTFQSAGYAGYMFSYWTGLPTLTDPYTFSVDDDYTVGAVFYHNGSDVIYILTPGMITGDGSINVTIAGNTGNTIPAPFDSTVILAAGTNVKFTATAGTGYVFSYWMGLPSLADSYTFSIDNNYAVGAVFSTSSGLYTLTFGTITGSGSISISINGGQAVLFDSQVKVAGGTSVKFQAAGNAGYVFSYWTGIPALSSTYVFNVNGNYTVGAVFSPNTTAFFTVVPDAITGNGTISISINGEPSVPFTTPIYSLPKDTRVTFTATAGTGYTFSYWTGLPSLADPYTFPIDNNYAVGAVFSISSGLYTLDPGTMTNGSVYISINGGPSVPFDLPVNLASGTSVKFQAAGSAGYMFSYWTGLPTLLNPYAFNVDGNYTVGAVFYHNGFDVVYRLVPGTITGNGTMTISIGGNDMLFDAPLILLAGTNVKITAAGKGSYGFLYWIGLPTSNNPYTFSVDKNYKVDAVFYDTSKGTVYTLTPGTIGGSGNMYITIGNGTEMPFDSPVKVISGMSVTIRAEGNGNFKFSYWTGLAALSSAYTFNVNGNMTIGAVFYENGSDVVYRLTPGEIIGDGTEYITIAGGKEAVFDSPVTVIVGTPVTFRAAGSDGYTFREWLGDLSGTADKIALTVSSNMIVSAEFSSSNTITHMFCWLLWIIIIEAMIVCVYRWRRSRSD